MSSLKARLVENPCKKSLKLMLSSHMNVNLAKHQISPTEELFAVKYNEDLTKALESDYKTKNSSLFTWRHNVSQQEYIRAPTSTKKTASQADIRLEDITDIGALTEMAASMSSPLNRYANMRITDTCFNPFRNIELRKRPKTRDMTNEGFDDNFPNSAKHKKGYSVTKLQMDLLTNEASGPENVPNFEYMSNQFDRKNYTVNKIISQINAQNERLDKGDIKAETVRKLQYVTGNLKLQKSLKPKTAATSMTRSKILFSPKDTRSNDLDFAHGSDNRLSQQKFSITINSKKGSKGLKYLLDIPDSDSLYLNSKGGRTSLATRMEDGSELQLINKAKYGHVVQRISKSHRAKEPIKPDKSTPKWLIEGVGTGIKEMEKRMDEEMQGKEGQREVKSSRNFVRVHPKNGFGGTFTPKYDRSPMMSPDKMEMNDENIFNFGKYFKKKYMEKETPFEVSKDLQKRINSFEKGLQASARKSQIFGKSVQLSENIKY